MDTFENRPVVFRLPFNRAGEVLVKAGGNAVFPDKTFEFNHDKPYELAYITFKLTALAEGSVCDPQFAALDRLLTVRMTDCYHNHPIGQLSLIAVGDGAFRWTPIKPMRFHPKTTMQIAVEARDTFDVAFDGARRRIHEIRIEAIMEGEQLILGPRATGVEAPLG